MSKRWAATNVLKYMGKYMGNLWIYPLYLYHLIVIWFPSAIVSKKKKRKKYQNVSKKTRISCTHERIMEDIL